jgi:5'-3' exonuclease
MKNHITPVFIFDGKPPKEKDETIQSRKEKREFMIIRRNIYEHGMEIKDKLSKDDFKKDISKYIETHFNNDSFVMDEDEINLVFERTEDELLTEIDKLSKKIIYVTNYHIETSKELFDLFGVKYIHAPCEAESLLAMLCRNNYIDGCISEDTDILANGGHLFLRNFNADKNTIEEYCLHGILDNLKMTQEQFVDMCILCGCDYTTKINGMGPITAHKLITKYGSIEEVLKNNHKFSIPDNFDYIKARDLFKNPISEDIFNTIDKNMKMKEPKLEELKEFLKKTKLKEKYLKDIDKNLMNYYLNIEGVCTKNNKKEEPAKKIRNKKITDYFS